MTRRVLAFLLLLLLVAGQVWAADAQPARALVATEGQGYLETVDGYRVLHLKGTPEEMGRQHGRLLRKAIAENVGFLLREGDAVRLGDLKITRPEIAAVLNAAFAGKIPDAYFREM